jgi:histidinol-phosphatase (PHP family)
LAVGSRTTDNEALGTRQKQQIVLTDYHTHTFRCGHATGTMREYIEAAIARGIGEIGLTDHLWLYFEEVSRRNPEYAMAEDSYAAHYAEMVALRDEYRGRINVRVSVEADYIQGRESDLLAILGRFEFDYVLGSVHFMDGWLLDHPDFADRYRQERVAEIYRRYYARLGKAVELGCFDLLAHFDLPKKFGFLPEEDLSAIVGKTLDAVAAKKLAIEISSAGLRKPIGEIYPARAILREMRSRDIPIAFSSDAHAPQEVGADYEKLLELARSEGYDQLVVFERRQRRAAALG